MIYVSREAANAVITKLVNDSLEMAEELETEKSNWKIWFERSMKAKECVRKLKEQIDDWVLELPDELYGEVMEVLGNDVV